MADTNRLAAVVAELAERDDEFRSIETLAVEVADDEPLWPLSLLKSALGYEESESIEGAVNRAKVAASKSGWTIKEHFRDGDLFECPGELFVSKYAAYLIVTGCDPSKKNVAVALTYFALQTDKQRLEDEKRLKTRLDVATENHKLAGIASDKGVKNFQRFNGVGVQGLYGGKNVKQIARMKGLPRGGNYLDYAGSEELAANLFRITQTAAALRRQEQRSENRACETHHTVAAGVRATIVKAGNTPPELLPPASDRIDLVATKVRKQITK